MVSFRYYYLVWEEVYTEAGAITAYNEGGASYYLEDGQNEWVALAVYTSVEDACVVQEMLCKKKRVNIVEKGIDTLYFKGKKQKASANTYVSGLKIFDRYIRMLEECIYRLDNGLSQEKARDILSLIRRQFIYCGTIYDKEFPVLAQACIRAQNRLETIYKSVIKTKDLRYLVCEMAEENISMAREFVL